MTTHTLRRWGAVLIAGGLIAGGAYAFFPSNPSSSLLQPCAALVLVGLSLLIAGLVAFQSAQSERAPINGWTGAGLLAVGLVLLEFPHCILDLVDLQRMQDLDAYHASFLGNLQFPGIICIAVGEVVLGVAIVRARVYPRWAAWLVAANVALTVSSMAVPGLADWVRIPAPNYVLFGMLGTAMIALASRREGATSTQPATVTVA